MAALVERSSIRPCTIDRARYTSAVIEIGSSRRRDAALTLPPIALSLPMSFTCTRAPVRVSVSSLRRTDVRARVTHYDGVVVDERILTPRFPAVLGPERMQVFVLLAGEVTLHLDAPTPLAIGDAWLMPRLAIHRGRFRNARFFEIDWAAETPVPVAPLGASPALVALADELARVPDEGHAQRSYLERLLSAMVALGAPVPPEVRALEAEGPTPRDLRLGAAVAEQFAHLVREATIPHFSEDAALSGRQLQRIVADFHRRYGLNATNWRDTRNRWRIQVAVVLLSVPSLSVADIAAEVGFSDATALARAFARWSLPSPSELRAALARGEAD